MNVWESLEQLRSAEVRMLSLTELKTHTTLQPRNSRLVPIKDAGRVEQRSADHKVMLGFVLDCSQDVQLEPIWVADIQCSDKSDVVGGFYVVDGHHRRDAYIKAKRVAIPARVCSMDIGTAVLVSKSVNCTGRSLEMHREQRLDAAWQFIAAVTEQGTKPLPKGESTRTVARNFGIGHSTAGRMLAELGNVGLENFPTMMRDPGTGWPRWRYVRQSKSPWQTPIGLLSDKEQVQREAEKLARIIVDMVEKSSYEARARALEILANEEIEGHDSVEAVNFLADMLRPHGTHLEYVLPHWDRGTPAEALECPLSGIA